MVDYASKSMTSLAIDNATRCSWLVRNGFRGACQAAIKWRMAVMHASYSFKNGINHQRKRSSRVDRNSQSMSASRMAVANEFYRSSAHVWCFYSPFTFLVHFWLVICKSDPRSHYLRVLALTCASYQGSRQILSRRQHAPNKQCAPDNPILRYNF